MLDIHEDRIDIGYEAEIGFRFSAAFGLDSCVPSLGLAGLEQFPGKIRLHERIAAGQSDAAARMAEGRPVLLEDFNELADADGPSLHDQGPCRADSCTIAVARTGLVVEVPPSIIHKSDGVALAGAFTTPAAHTISRIVHDDRPPPL